MPLVKELTRSFAGGEITPEMYGRLDNVKFQTGLALCRNGQVLPHGPVTKRPGFAYVRAAGNSSYQVRLIPFAWSASQTMVLEFGHNYIRFHTQGATVLSGGVPYQITTPYSATDLFDLDYTQSADVVTLTHPNYPTQELRRLGATSWTLTAPTLGSSPTVPSTPTVTATAGTGTAHNKNLYYKVTTVTTDGIEESLPSGYGSASNDLSLPGSYNTIAWSTTGAGNSYRIYKAINGAGRLYGFIGETTDVSFVDDYITPDYSRNPPATTIRLDTAGNYPGTVTYYEQRRMFAGNNNSPQTIYGTKSATESNLNASIPSQADDALSFTIKAQQQNAIKHLVPLNDLIALTVGGAWKIASTNNQALSPSTLSARTQTAYGANKVHPLLTGISCLYVEANGRRVRDLAFSWQSQVYTSDDRSIMAPHLFTGYTLVDAAYMRSPDQVAWFVRSDGVLLGMTYVPEHQVFGWHQQVTNGAFESVCVVTENNEDILYAVVRRTINGVTTRMVERMASRQFATQADAFFVDCGVTFDGTNTSSTTVMVTGGTLWDPSEELTISASAALFAYPGTTDINDAIVFTAADGSAYRLTITQVLSSSLAKGRPDRVLPVAYRGVATAAYAFARDSVSGLTWLAGANVMVLADGAVVSNLTVSAGGAITLPSAASKVQIGLPFTMDIQTLPMAIESMMAGGQGTTKSVDYAFLRVYRSGIIKVGPSSNRLTTIPPRTNENYDTPPRLRSEVLDLLVNPDITQDAQLWIQSDDPTPLTLSALTMKVSIGG